MFVRTTRLALAGLLAAVTIGCGFDGPDADDVGDDTDGAATTDSTQEADGETTADSDDTGSDEPAAVEPNGIVVDVIAVDNTFRPEDTEIVAGTEIRWENRGRSGHNVLPVDDTLDWGVQVDEFLPGDEYTLLFDTPGTYPYYCSLHGTTDFGMIGTIVVTG